VIADWKKTDAAQRKEAETKMQAQWKKWMTDNAKMFVDVAAGVGKTKLVNTRGTSDLKNDIMLYSVAQAESHEAAAKSFEGHPHLQIPQASIEVMEIHSLQGWRKSIPSAHRLVLASVVGALFSLNDFTCSSGRLLARLCLGGNVYAII
jgi:hypothetical protein